jgi:hypothetical protein
LVSYTEHDKSLRGFDKGGAEKKIWT